MRSLALPLPLYCTSLGKAFLAAKGEAEAKTLLRQETFEAQTNKTLTDFKSLWGNISATFAMGYAVQDEEYMIGLRGAAACIYDEDGKARRRAFRYRA